MVSLLQETLHGLYCQPPPPSKGVHRFTIAGAEVMWNTWRISFQPSQEKVFPKEVKKLHKEFLLDQQLQSKYCTGKQRIHQVLEAISALVKRVRNVLLATTRWSTQLIYVKRHYDFLIRMPENVIIHILSFLDADDLQELSKTCKKFQQLCSSEEVWERVKLLREKTALGKKMMTCSDFKKLMSFHAKSKRMQRRQGAFF